MGFSKLLDINFYVLMVIVLGVLYFYHSEGHKKGDSAKKDRKILKILISVYLILTLSILFLNINF